MKMTSISTTTKSLKSNHLLFVIIYREPESHLKDEMEELCKRIKQLAKLDSYSVRMFPESYLKLILKELPRYVTKKHIEEFFGLPEPQVWLQCIIEFIENGN